MAFRYIDDSAWPATDDAPLDAAALQRLRDNAEAVSDERKPRAGWATSAEPEWDMCAVLPTAFGPWSIYLDPEERWATIDVEVQHKTVQNSDVHMWAGVYVADTGQWTRPPRTTDEWDASAAGHTFDSADPAGTVSLSADVPSGASGWIIVALWVQSDITGVDYDKSGGSGGVEVSIDGIVYAGTDGFDGTKTEWTDPPTMAVKLSQSALGGAIDFGPWAQVILADENTPGDATDDVFVLYPPPAAARETTTTSIAWTASKLGILPVGGVSLEGQPVQFELDWRQFAPGLGVGEGNVGALARSIDRMASTRIRQFGCFPGSTTKESQRYWQYISIDATGAPADVYACAGGLVTPKPIDSNGYTAFVAYYLRRAAPTVGGNDGEDIGLDWKLKMVDPTLPTPVVKEVSATVTVLSDDYVLVPRALALAARDDYRPIMQTMNALQRSRDDVRLRGMLGFDSRRKRRHDFDYINIVKLDIDEGSLTYPCIPAITVSNSTASVSTFSFKILVVACGFASRSTR